MLDLDIVLSSNESVNTTEKCWFGEINTFSKRTRCSKGKKIPVYRKSAE